MVVGTAGRRFGWAWDLAELGLEDLVHTLADYAAE
jgi:hypothetical protein